MRALPRVLVDWPREQLGIVPTPFTLAPALGVAIGAPALWFKREELLGFGFGGNKVRTLSLILADVRRAGGDVLVTGAGAHSNWVRAAAAATAAAQLPLEAVFWGDPPPQAGGNYLLTRLLGARCRFTGDADRASVDRGIAARAAELRGEGREPYTVALGGACALGVLAHALAAAELAEQSRAAGVAPAVVAMAVGSGTTLAGWLLGRKLLAAPWRIEGFTVSRPAAEIVPRVAQLFGEAAALLGAAVFLDRNEVIVHDGFVGPGYGVPSLEGNAAIRLAAHQEGIFLDPTYTAKAFAGLCHHLHTGQIPDDRPLVFVHTGGEPALFIHPEIAP
ncbi:MAG TPA: pyridoxal-phosphate dependent enzyme [Haliangiales bacterium]|nr:pyridoxal-phosphate dependent enzyme [Haliangiales bacterium]